ncbi:hypothetical protein ACFL96_09310 [Thermoproteota archaeon]
MAKFISRAAVKKEMYVITCNEHENTIEPLLRNLAQVLILAKKFSKLSKQELSWTLSQTIDDTYYK